MAEGRVESLPEKAVEALARSAGLEDSFILHPIQGGANNRLFRVDIEGGPAAVLKCYFRHPTDPRDRLHAEFSFSSFAWEIGLRCLPRPLAKDDKQGWGLYGYVDGSNVRQGEVSRDMVLEALAFFEGLNRREHRKKAQGLSAASEACFRLTEHLDLVGRRIQRLCQVERRSSLHEEVLAFVREELLPGWQEPRPQLERRAKTLRLDLDEPLAPEERCVSPSDFGFHNALKRGDGSLVFLDFEYAGWDDPAKLVGDFFCQPAVPVPSTHYEAFAEGIVSCLGASRRHRPRIDLLRPVYQMKWCCILLNQFLPEGSARRRFAGRPPDESRGARQLLKARERLQDISAG